MAKFFNASVLLSLAVYIMVVTSAPTVHVLRQARTAKADEAKANIDWIYGLKQSVSFSYSSIHK